VLHVKHSVAPARSPPEPLAGLSGPDTRARRFGFQQMTRRGRLRRPPILPLLMSPRMFFDDQFSWAAPPAMIHSTSMRSKEL